MSAANPNYQERNKPPGPSTRELENRVWARYELKAGLPLFSYPFDVGTE